MKLAAVTMVFNEPDYIGLWCRHYGSQFGEENCYIIDHGSNDGTTTDLGRFNIVKYPRSPMDDTKRAKLISHFCSDLLWKYDAIIYVDVDELLVADPRYHNNLQTALSKIQGVSLNAIGLEVLHLTESEQAIDIRAPVSLQRQWVWFNSGLCKAFVMRTPFDWAPGFHCAPGPVKFSNIYLFHLRYFDHARGLSRLAKTRQMPWASAKAAPHQKMSDADWLARLNRYGRYPKSQAEDLDMNEGELKELLEKVQTSSLGREKRVYNYDTDILGTSLWRVPSRFRNLF